MLEISQIDFADTPPTAQLSGVATMVAVSSKLYGRRRTLIKPFDIIIVSSVRLGGESFEHCIVTLFTNEINLNSIKHNFLLTVPVFFVA